MSSGTPIGEDKNYWRGQADAHFATLKEGQEKIHNCLKKHIEQTEKRLNGVEQKVAVHSTNIKIHWLLVAVILASILGLGVKAAFGMEEASRDTVQFYKDGSIRYDYSVKLIGQDTLSFGPFRVKGYRSFGFYMRAEDTDSIDLGAISLQSDIQDSVFARVEGYSVIDTSFTDSAIAHWYAVYPSGLTYITYYVYGNAGNDASDSCSVRVRLVFGTWKGTMETIPGTGVYVHHHDAFDKPVDFRDSVTFWGLTFPDRVPYRALRWTPDHQMLYPLTDLDVALGDGDHRFGTIYTRYLYMNGSAILDGYYAGEIRCGADFSPMTNANKNLGRSDGRWDTTFTVYAEIDTTNLKGDVETHGFVNFYADSIEQGRPALVYGYNSDFAYLYPDPGRGFPGSQIYFNFGSPANSIDTAWFREIYSTKIKFAATAYLSAPALDLTLWGFVSLKPGQTNTVNLGTAAQRWKGIHGRSVHCDSLATTFASIDTLLATMVSKDATAAMTIQPGSYAFNVAGYLTTGLFFNSSGYASFMGVNDEFFRVTVSGTDKGDVTLFDNAATPVQHMWWNASDQHLYFTSTGGGAYIDASTASELTVYGSTKLELQSGGDITLNARLRPTSDHGVSLGSGAYAFDTVYAADFDVTSGMFSGTGEEALNILQTVQALPGDRLDHEAIHPYLTPSSPNAVSLNRWIALLTVAVQELQSQVDSLKGVKKKTIEELSR